MAGQLIPLISRRSFDFASGSSTYVAVKAVPVVNYDSGSLLVRIHSGTFTGTSKIEVVAQTTAPSNDDPSIDFLAATPVATATINTSSTILVTASLAANFGAFLQIKVVGTLDTGNCKAVISADLAVKD